MRRNFEKSVQLTMPLEGGYSNDPHDPGGPTMKGVTIGTFSAYLGHTATIDELKAITDEQIYDIARQLYWNACRCDDLPDGVDYAVFDYGWGSGTGTAARHLQKIVGAAVDGDIGPKTLAAVAQIDKSRLVTAICQDHLTLMRGLSTWSVFGAGWTNRVNAVQREALIMAEQAPEAPAPTAPTNVQPPPTAKDLRPAVAGAAIGFGAWLWHLLGWVGFITVVGGLLLLVIHFRHPLGKLLSKTSIVAGIQNQPKGKSDGTP